jgi:hypothetical protein
MLQREQKLQDTQAKKQQSQSANTNNTMTATKTRKILRLQANKKNHKITAPHNTMVPSTTHKEDLCLDILPKYHFQAICLIVSTTSLTDASLLLNNLSLRALQIDHKATCHNNIKPLFLRFETPIPTITANEIERFRGEI